jgi:hypothetical protein
MKSLTLRRSTNALFATMTRSSFVHAQLAGQLSVLPAFRSGKRSAKDNKKALASSAHAEQYHFRINTAMRAAPAMNRTGLLFASFCTMFAFWRWYSTFT